MPIGNTTVNEVDLSVSLLILLNDALVFLNDVGSYENPYWAAAAAIFEIAQLAGMPNPLDVMVQAFTGRPKQVATIQIAIRLLNTRNSVSRLWGIQIARYLIEDDAVLSDSHPAVQKIWYHFFSQFVEGLEKQGITKGRALSIAHFAYTEAAQSGAKAEPELLRAQPDWLRPYGDPAIQTIYDREVARLDKKHLTEAQINHRASIYVMQHATLQELATIRWVHWQQCLAGAHFDPITETCQGGEPPTPICPPGYVWNIQTQKCESLCPPGTVWNPQTETCDPIPPPPPPLDLEGDEFTDCCSQTQNNLLQINTSIQSLISLGGQGDGGSSTKCCAEITAQLADIVTTLASIANKSALVEVDFSQLITPLAEAAVELTCICTAIQAAIAAYQSGEPETPIDLSHLNAAADLFVANTQQALADLIAIDADIQSNWSAYGNQ